MPAAANVELPPNMPPGPVPVLIFMVCCSGARHSSIIQDVGLVLVFLAPLVRMYPQLDLVVVAGDPFLPNIKCCVGLGDSIS